jgi:uncharacterized protein (UPF0548 family)
VENFLSAKAGEEFYYSEVGMTREIETTPTGYTRDHYRVKIGEGTLVFEQAVEALKRWAQFDLEWVNVCSTDIPIAEGSMVGLLAHLANLWLLFACRIVYVIDEDVPLKKYGFAYGTLAGHPECGEERFTVEWNASDNNVWYDILAFSHPASLLIQAAYPLGRSIQKQFAKDSQTAMVKLVVAGSSRHEIP